MCICNQEKQSWKNRPALKSSLDSERSNAKQGLLCRIGIDIPGVYSLSGYDFLTGDAPLTVHDNLWEQAKLNMEVGLFRVNRLEDKAPIDKTEKYNVKKGDVFQLRGYDLANMTIVFDGAGWIVMDVLTTRETAQAAWVQIVQLRLAQAPINMVVYSHSHIDHYGGIGGLEDYFAPGCSVIAPEGFTLHAVTENIYAGTAMSRRAVYQYGNSLKRGVGGQVDCGLGKTVANGTNNIRKPDEEIGFKDYETEFNYAVRESNGLILQIQLTPGTEAPAEMNVYMPFNKVLFIAENCAGTLHNLLTPRGAAVRDPLAWAGFLDQTLTTFSALDTVCSAHNWPHFTKNESIRFMEIQRDMYRYLNNATLHLINLGYTIDEVGRMISGEDGSLPLPGEFADEWCCHGFYGSYNHDAKAVYQRYIGWYDGNPAHLNRHKPSERATRYVKAFGADVILDKARLANGTGDYEWAAELLDYLVNADSSPELAAVRETAVDEYRYALTQMGYQSEAASWRNMYLTGAKELTNTAGSGSRYLSFPDDTVNAMTLEMILQYLGIMLDSKAVLQSEYRRRVMICVSDDKKGENVSDSFAAAYVYRGILGYRITSALPEDSDFPQSIPSGKELDISIKGTKLDFFRAFVDKDSTALDKLVILGGVAELTGYLTRFSLDFPIMTPRSAY